MSSQYFIPPINFGYVEEDIFRSGQPNELNFPFLETLGIKLIIWVATEEPNQTILNFIEDQKIKLENFSNFENLQENIIAEILELILNSNNFPLIIMCDLGRHRTGTVVGCLRKIQKWNLNSIFEEYRRYTGQKVRILNEQFIELFDTEMVNIPKIQPKWL